jgi:peptide/nickel transport system ATP-binding protein
MEDNVVLEVRDLKKYFRTSAGAVHAVDGVSFTIEKGMTLGLVGESGCGKTTTGRVILRLTEPTSGKIIFDGVDITAVSQRQLREVRRDMQIIFQDPFSSLNPRKTVLQTIEEGIKLSEEYSDPDDRFRRALELMRMVGLDERLVNAFPHELDGGRRQRVGVARALSLKPKLIVCDEPVSSLDVSIQAQILNMLKALQQKMGLTYLFITHDLSVVHHISDAIAVMYLGRIVEKAPATVLFDSPQHPYTQALLSALPIPSIHDRRERIILKGEVQSAIDPKPMCRFAPRCEEWSEECLAGEPVLKEVSKDHFVACYKVGEGR